MAAKAPSIIIFFDDAYIPAALINEFIYIIALLQGIIMIRVTESEGVRVIQFHLIDRARNAVHYFIPLPVPIPMQQGVIILLFILVILFPVRRAFFLTDAPFYFRQLLYRILHRDKTPPLSHPVTEGLRCILIYQGFVIAVGQDQHVKALPVQTAEFFDIDLGDRIIQVLLEEMPYFSRIQGTHFFPRQHPYPGLMDQLHPPASEIGAFIYKSGQDGRKGYACSLSGPRYKGP